MNIYLYLFHFRGVTELVVIKKYVFPSLSHFDLIFIVLRWEQVRRMVRAVRAEFNAILRLIRTFKAVNEDWPHVPSSSSPRPAPSYAHPLHVLCVHMCVRAYAISKVCWYRAYMQLEHLWHSTPNVFYSITISSGAVTYARLSKVARACQFDEVWRPLEHYCDDKMNRRSILSSSINWYYCVRITVRVCVYVRARARARACVCVCVCVCVWCVWERENELI